MRVYMVRSLVFLLAIYFSLLNPDATAEVKRMRTIMVTHGSIPPAQMLYACVHELDNKPFSDAQIKECASKIAANHFIRDVKTNAIEENGIWSVEFIVSGDPLLVEELTVESFDKQGTDLLKFLSLNDNNLRDGGIFNLESEISTYEGIRQFYRAKGQSVGVVPKVSLNYKRGKAWVNLKVVSGPTIPSDPLVPPYGKACSDHITYINWLDTDDGVPIELVESGLALRSPFTCFSVELAQRDKAYLANMAILTAHFVDYSGEVNDRHIQYKLKAKPLKVGQVDLRGFGTVPFRLATIDPGLPSKLDLKTGEAFSRSAVHKSVEYLRKTFSRGGYWNEVTFNEEPLGVDTLRITFDVLVFPLQTVIVDDQEIQCTSDEALALSCSPQHDFLIRQKSQN